MALWASDAVRAAAANYLAANADTMIICAGQPTDYADAISKRLGQVTLSPGDATVQMSGQDRLLAVAAKSGVAITTSGTADHVALVNATSSSLLFVTTCPAEPVFASSTVNVAAWSAAIVGHPVIAS